MVHDIRIRDRQDHAGFVFSEPRIEGVLQVDHVGSAVRAVLGVHAVIGRDDDGGSELVEPREIPVDHRVEIIGRRRAGSGLVLDVVGRGEIHEVGPLFLHELDAGDEDEFRQRRAVHGGQRHADALEHALDPVLRQRDLVGFFGGEANTLHLVAQEFAQLVLRRDDGHLRPRLGKRGENGADSQMARVVHHHFFAALGIEEVIAADAVYRGRNARHDRQVVGVGEARHDAVGDEAGARACEQTAEKGRSAGCDGGRDVLVFTAIDADDDQRAIHPVVASAIDKDVGRQVLFTPRRSPSVVDCGGD